MKTEPLLSIKGLSAHFGDPSKEVVSTVDVDVYPGQTIAIVGESGSGKTVTSLSIMRLIDSPPIAYPSGEIRFHRDDIDLLQSDPETLRALRGQDIAMIFQEPMTSLNPLKRCGQQIIEALTQHQSLSKSKARARVIELLQKVQLPDPERAFKAYPHELSGGQKQRVMIAMAISCEPSILIADEPTTALDVTVQRDIIELLQALQRKEGMAMIFISHDLGVVAEIADELIVMHKGKAVEQGPAKPILHEAKAAYTKGLLSSRPPVSTRPHRLLTVADHLQGTAAVVSEESPSERSDRHRELYAQAPILEVEDLHTWYPIHSGLLSRVRDYVKAVNGVSLKLHKGETLGAVGESGCGKSTLGRSIIGLEKKQAGHVRYHGTDLDLMTKADRAKAMRQVQMIFQDPYSSLDPRQCIGEAIREPMIVHGLNGQSHEQREVVISLLEKVGLEADHYGRYPHEFSGGQRQRISIARTLAMQPEIIICDESVSALDVSVQAQVLNLLNDLKDDFGLSYIFISHDLSVVKYMSDRVMVMQKGTVVESGEADQVYARPSQDYTKKLIASAYALELPA